MTLYSRSDVVQQALRIRNERNDLKKLEEGKVSCKDYSEPEADKLVANLRAIEEDRERQKASISIDHQKFLQGDFLDLWTDTLGGQNGSSLKINGRKFQGLKMYKVINKKIRLHKLKDDEEDDSTQPIYYTIIPLTPVNMNAFLNLRRRYQYFRINRIGVNFVSNSATNLSPILCRYIPPTIRNMQGDANFYTKVAESAGTKEGYMSIHTPPYLMKQLRVTSDEQQNKYYMVDSVVPELKTGRACCDYDESQWYLDYGAFYFETKNQVVQQDIIMRVHYKIDFYTGYDYESYLANPELFPYDPYAEPEEEEEDGDGEDGDDTGNSKPTSSQGSTSSRIEKRVPRNLLTRKGK